MVLSGKDAQRMSAAALNAIPIVTRSGNIIRLEQLATIDIISAPSNINRLGGKQSMSLQLRPNESLTLEDAVEQIETEILPDINAMARDAGVSISLRGAASAMDQTWKAMQSNVVTGCDISTHGYFASQLFHAFDNFTGNSCCGGRRHWRSGFVEYICSPTS